MTILKNAYKSTIGQRKILAVLVLALMVSNSNTSTAYAAVVPAIPVSKAVSTQLAVADVSTSDETTQSDPVAAPAHQPTVQEVLLVVCKQNGYGEDCAKTLLGMLWNESSNISTAIGDNGKARGYFQIHYKLHKISVDCAEDLVCSANWSLNYLESNSYPKYVSYAIQCHNSCNVQNGYAAKALRNGKNLWNKPLEIKQDAPITLAVN